MSLFSYDGSHQPTGTAPMAVFAKVDALPCAHVQPTVGNRDGKAYSGKCRLGMGWHVVITLKRVYIFRTSLGYDTIKNRLHVYTHVRVAILVDAQSATRMLTEDIQDALLRQRR